MLKADIISVITGTAQVQLRLETFNSLKVENFQIISIQQKKNQEFQYNGKKDDILQSQALIVHRPTKLWCSDAAEHNICSLQCTCTPGPKCKPTKVNIYRKPLTWLCVIWPIKNIILCCLIDPAVILYA